MNNIVVVFDVIVAEYFVLELMLFWVQQEVASLRKCIVSTCHNLFMTTMAVVSVYAFLLWYLVKTSFILN